VSTGQDLVPVLIGAAALAAAVLLKRRRGPPTASGAKNGLALVAPGRLLGDAGLVATREFADRVRGRIFRVSTLLVLVAISLAIAIPRIISTQNAQRVGLVSGLPSSAPAAVLGAGRRSGATIVLVEEPALTRALAALRAGRLDLVVTSSEILLDKAPAPTDTSATAQLARTLSTTLGIARAVQTARLSRAQASVLAKAKPLPLHGLQHGTDQTTQSASLIGLPLLFILFVVYNSWLLTGVMEEKASRIAEVLLSILRPVDLLAGKIVGIGMVAIFQAGLIVATTFAVTEAVGSNLLHGATGLFIVATAAWLLLGYAFYSWVYAAAGSLAERRDQAQSLALPLATPISFGYVVALAAQTSGHANLLVEILAYLPPTAPFAMPALVGLDAATWWQFALSAAISVVSTVLVARPATAVYRRAVLHTGGRVHLRDVLTALTIGRRGRSPRLGGVGHRS
jgi:ABC-2 type transport system permease protein